MSEEIKQENNDLALQLVNLLRNSLNVQLPSANLDNLSIGIKLSGGNYQLWATLMKKAVGGRGQGHHLTGTPPLATYPNYTQWETNDQCVFTWLIQNIEPNLVNNVSQYPTAKALWEGLAVTYGTGSDSLQVFDLHKRANSIKQGGGTLEDLWNRLQSVWMEIDRRDPNPMKDPDDITVYNNKIQEQRLFQLLMAVEERFEIVKRNFSSVNLCHHQRLHMQPSKGKKQGW